MHYKEYPPTFYCRNGGDGQELQLGKGFKWKPVVWQPNLGTFCSPSMHDEDEKGKPLPNKVSAWLRGCAFGALVRVTKCDTTPYYLQLREMRDGKLHVYFKDLPLMKYSRASDIGGLGFEVLAEAASIEGSDVPTLADIGC